ncbi:MAG: DNA mismatch repair endonuclease MutL [Alphaproteobacteria bacterium]|nr:DNA mismatch repair endonuclease MutL [Alphaproteobacteria bacterium]
MNVRFLDPTLINQIAAGEVIERPASAIKELVENAIDAQATKIDIVVREGGRTLISITDNGQGMSQNDLNLSVERHATSKIPDSDLFNIRTLGFRGEALPSIGAVSRLTIISRTKNDDSAWRLTVEGGSKSALSPTSFGCGTRVEVRDLFYATPARLKFLKSPSTELSHIVDILSRLALAHPEIHFSLFDGERQVFSYTNNMDRISAILGKDFLENSCPVLMVREGLTLKGKISVPTFNRSSAATQYLFVNGRPVKDKLLSAAVRVAYQDFLASNRHPVLALFLDIDPAEVDINVHPAKAEVRFRDAGLVRGTMISALKNALQEAAHQSSTTISKEAIVAFQRPTMTPGAWTGKQYSGPSLRSAPSHSVRLSFPEQHLAPGLDETIATYHAAPLSAITIPESAPEPSDKYPLGFARAQIHGTYILSETPESLVIVDQHAAHERLVYEKMKQEQASAGIKRQTLLLPEIVDLPDEALKAILSRQQDLHQLGLVIDKFGLTAIMVREVPAILGKADWKQLIYDLSSEILDMDTTLQLSEQLNEIMGTLACHNSVRAGRQLSLDEMNALLRQMEATPYSGQCNHGRPTYIKLQRPEIEKLFGRR